MATYSPHTGPYAHVRARTYDASTCRLSVSLCFLALGTKFRLFVDITSRDSAAVLQTAAFNLFPSLAPVPCTGVMAVFVESDNRPIRALTQHLAAARGTARGSYVMSGRRDHRVGKSGTCV
jgi:hypothetical protein